MASGDASVPTRQVAFDYDRTVVAFHGTRRGTADKLVAGMPFGHSENDDDWLGHGIYFWEYAPQQAWWWAKRRYGGNDAAVVGSLVRLGRCIDLLDPSNAELLVQADADLGRALKSAGQSIKNNATRTSTVIVPCSTICSQSWSRRTFKSRVRERYSSHSKPVGASAVVET